jgi:hypothetical protein
LAVTAAAAAIFVAASADAGFIYSSASRSISLSSPAGVSGASSDALSDFFEFRSYSTPMVSGGVQQASTLGVDSLSFGAFAQLFSSSTAFAGPFGGTSASSVVFSVDSNLIAGLNVGTAIQQSGAAASSSVSVVLRDLTSNIVIYSTSTTASDSFELELIEGRNYQFEVAGAASVNSGAGSSFMNYSVSITVVPAPGVLATFGLAATVRRRRR